MILRLVSELSSSKLGQFFKKFSDNPTKCLDASRAILFASVFLQYLFFIDELNFLFLSDSVIYKIFYFLFLFSLIMILYGRFASIFILIGGFCHMFFVKQNPFVFGGWASVLPFLFLMHFLYEYFRYKNKLNSQSVYYFIGALLSFASIIYFNANVHRFFEPAWSGGLMVESILTNTYFSRIFHLSYMVDNRALFTFLTYFTLVLECLGSFLIFWPLSFRRVLIFLLLGLHFSILILVKVQIWSLVMISLLILGLCKMPWDFSRKNYKSHIFLRTTLVYLLFFTFCLTMYRPYTSKINRWLELTNLFNFRSTRVFQRIKLNPKFKTTIYGFEKNNLTVLYDSDRKHIDSPALIENSAISHILQFRTARRSRFNSDKRECVFYQSLFQNKSSFVLVHRTVNKKDNQRIRVYNCSADHTLSFEQAGFKLF